jgi:hypothetical protein
MSYLLIKQNDVKTFKAFISGREIEVGVVIPSKANMFSPGEEIEIFYGENSDTYKAKVVRNKRPEQIASNAEQALVMVSLMKW